MNAFCILSYLLGLPVLSGTAATILTGRHYKTTRIPGLLFHSILPEPRMNLSHFSLTTFKYFNESLSRENITPVTVSAVAECNPADKKKQCLLTFDDGLENVYTYARPVLNQYNYKSTIFCVAGYSGKQSSWDVYKESRHLSTGQIRQLCDDGHEIGSHSLTHSDLTYCSPEDVLFELTESKKILEDITGKQIRSISFPHGGWNNQVWEAAQKAGYQYATLYTKHNLASQNMFPVISAGRFDSVNDCLKKVQMGTHFSPSIAISRLGSHFAKGTPLWKFRKNYRIV